VTKKSVGRWLVGKPRVWVGAVWFGLGILWLLIAVIDGPTPTRLLLAAAWMALGLLNGVVAFFDRKHRRGFYEPAPARTFDE
jgi:apolipoprotein N-acyltransferase